MKNRMENKMGKKNGEKGGKKGAKSMGNRRYIKAGIFLFGCLFFVSGAGGRAEGKKDALGSIPEEKSCGLSANYFAKVTDADPWAGKAVSSGYMRREPEKEGRDKKGGEIVLGDADLREMVYEKLGKASGSPLYEEELQKLEGRLELTGVVNISLGADLDFIRAYCDTGSVYEWEVVFTPDLHGWEEGQLAGLGDLEQRVKICGSDGTVPASVLPFFTGTSELIFEFDDTEGKIPEGKSFPAQVKTVGLYQFAEGKYSNLLQNMRESEVEQLVLYDAIPGEGKNCFWLDQAAGMKKLEYLDAGSSFLRVREPESLEGMGLRELCGAMDTATGLDFLKKLEKLEKVTLAVTEESDLEPLLAEEGLALRLTFCREMAEFEEGIYTGEGSVVNGSLDRMLDWKEDKEEEGNFLAIYQRYADEGRRVECFSVRGWGEEEEMYNVRTFLRVTDGKRVYELDPEDGEWGFGDYRQDYVSLKDINFDGVKDITLDMGSFGNQGASYEAGWIWDSGRGEYIRCDTYNKIVNPRVDGEHKLVRSSWRNWAASHSWAIYRYENGEFVMKSELTEELLYGEQIPEGMEVPENAEVWQWVERIYEDGKVAETRSFVIAHVEGEKDEYPEAYEKFYEEDSYWG